LTENSRGSRYARFVALAAVIDAALFGLGYLPTRRLAGGGGVAAAAVGCLISFAGAALAGWLVMVFPAETPTARMQRAFLAMTIRLAAAVALGLAAVLSGAVPRMPLLFWLATSYVVLLPLEVKLAIRER
jgi:hypothetical protein